MSVLVLEPKKYTQIKNRMISFTFRNICDINYCGTVRDMTEKQIYETVKTWSILNELSYCDKYEGEKFTSLHLFIEESREKSCNIYQLLKWLQCIKYNIELDTIKDKKLLKTLESKEIASYNNEQMIMIKNPLHTLDKMIDEISMNIIKEIEEYKNADWG